MFWYLSWWKKDFSSCQKIFKHLLPTLIYGLITALVSVVDVFIISHFLPITAVNGAAVGVVGVNLIIFTIFAATGSGSIYYGQMLRQKKVSIEMIKQTTRFRIMGSYVVVVFFLILFFSIGTNRIVGFMVNHNPEATHYGDVYLRYLLLTLIFIPFLYSSYSTLNASGKSIIPMFNNIMSVATNLGVTLLLIEPKIGDMGILAAPIGTLIARVLETLFISMYLYKTKPMWLPGWRFWKIGRWMLKKGTITAFLLLPSEILYIIFLLTMQVIVAHTETQVTLAGVNVVNLSLEIYYSLLTALYSVVPRYISSFIGVNDHKQAKINSQKILAVICLLAMFFATILFSSAFWWPYLFSTHSLPPQGFKIVEWMLIGNSFGFFLYCNAYATFTVVRAGGYQAIVSCADQSPYFLIYLPLLYVLLAFHVMAPYLVMFTVAFTVIIQYCLAIFLYYKVGWCTNNLITEITQEQNTQTTLEYQKNLEQQEALLEKNN